MKNVVSIEACPRCGAEARVPIVYGYPNERREGAAWSGQMVLGGCCISEDSPAWMCGRCDHSWGRIPWEE